MTHDRIELSVVHAFNCSLMRIKAMFFNRCDDYGDLDLLVRVLRLVLFSRPSFKLQKTIITCIHSNFTHFNSITVEQNQSGFNLFSKYSRVYKSFQETCRAYKIYLESSAKSEESPRAHKEPFRAS